MCECAGFNYTDECSYPQLPTGYPQSYEREYLPPGGRCGIFAILDAAHAMKNPRVEMCEQAPARYKVAGLSHLRDPDLRAQYAPFIPELQGQGVCGR